MTRVDFYLIPAAGAADRERFACRLTEKAYQLGHSIYIHTADEGCARALDELLWVWRQGSFVPHEIVAGAGVGTPVLIGYGEDPGLEPQQLLINLDAAVPSFFGSFERVAEIVGDQAEAREAGRNKYRHYQERGYPLHYHDLCKAAREDGA